ncbi:Anti-sigma-K factor rskA [Micromonospora nigra]|uniref:Anti-sigma-K factor rskA n=1 Tax=Micromonospora nigra TaxID=145857 RepID=A0A1C6SZD8_9ACTN|nr:anti-sigma factor [Micromonospora nigra]SCL34890.1 Anti-sigma-K factor rskA [Micromonospora nigra]
MRGGRGGARRPEPVPPRPPAAQERPWRRFAVTCAVAVVAAFGATAVTLVVDDERIRRERVTGGNARQVGEVVSAPDARVRTRTMQGGAAATVVVSPARDRAVVLLRDLRAPGEGRAYQLWLIGVVGPARPVRLLPVGATAATTVVGPVGDAATLGLSTEPAGGSSTPTRLVVLMSLA